MCLDVSCHVGHVKSSPHPARRQGPTCSQFRHAPATRSRRGSTQVRRPATSRRSGKTLLSICKDAVRMRYRLLPEVPVMGPAIA